MSTTNQVSRADHLSWCKKRALEYVASGDLQQAFASMLSDMRKHPETKDHSALQLGVAMNMSGHLSTPQLMREFINGFN